MQPSPQPHPQPRTLDDLLANAEHYARYCMGNSGRVTPALFFLGLDGQGMFVPQSLADDSAKDDFADQARLACVAHAAYACVMVLEAWARFAKPGEKLDTSEPPSEAMDREEYVILMGESRQGNRPRFLPIISAHSLAMMLTRKATGRVDGFVIEGPTAGGHNAPPRGRLELDGRGEPVYGERDLADLAAMRELGLPFWLAGGTGSPDAVVRALDAGAAGVQVGTLFAWSNESGIDAGLKQRVLAGVGGEALRVKTDIRASPTGFPFKVVELKGTNASAANYERRERVCDLGYLRQAYRRDDGRIDYRCAAEPVDTYLKKGGKLEDTVGRKCLCNGLMADIGLPQMREDGPELAILTSGDDLVHMEQFLAGRDSYSAGDVLDYLLSGMALAGAGAMAGMGVAVEGGLA